MENKEKKTKSIFEKKFFVVLFASIAAFTWGFAFPLIKIGFKAFAITATDTGSKTLFAGVRFLLAGIVTLLIGKMLGHKVKIKQQKDVWWLLAFGLVNTALHYFFFYMGLSKVSGARSAILDSLGTFFVIILACICFRDEHMTKRKILGCLSGFCGVFLLNFGSDMTQGGFSLEGDGMLICSGICMAFGGVMTRIVTQKVDTLMATGISLAFGGFVLILAGLLMGGSLHQITYTGILVLLLLVLVSSVGFSLYNQLICYNPVGEISIFNAFIPIIGAVLSCLMLREPFYGRYIVAGLLVVLGVYIINVHNYKTDTL